MLSVVYVDHAKNQLGFVSDCPAVADQLLELQNPPEKLFSQQAREKLQLQSPGVSDTFRAQYDETNKQVVRGSHEIKRRQQAGEVFRPVFLVTFDSLHAD